MGDNVFQFRHKNRTTFPNKHILICEDDIDCQIRLLASMRRLFEPQGEVIISVVSGSLAAAGIINQTFVNLIILDHDTPYGNGSDLLEWMKNFNIKIPVITASGIDDNNVAMIKAGASHKFSKDEVINGFADHIIKHILGFSDEI